MKTAHTRYNWRCRQLVSFDNNKTPDGDFQPLTSTLLVSEVNHSLHHRGGYLTTWTFTLRWEFYTRVGTPAIRHSFHQAKVRDKAGQIGLSRYKTQQGPLSFCIPQPGRINASETHTLLYWYLQSDEYFTIFITSEWKRVANLDGAKKVGIPFELAVTMLKSWGFRYLSGILRKGVSGVPQGGTNFCFNCKHDVGWLTRLGRLLRWTSP